MGSLVKSKSAGAKRAHAGEPVPARKIRPEAATQVQTGVPEIPPGALNEIQNQRGALITIITLLHCLHAALERKQDHIDDELNPRLVAAVRWVGLPEITAILLERVHAVHLALDSVNLANVRVLKS
jgi:hypothetical protein